MKTRLAGSLALLLMGCHVTPDSNDNAIQLTYFVRWAGAEPSERTFQASRAGFGIDLPSEVTCLPIWIESEKRQIGKAVYDDGKPPKHDGSQKIYKIVADAPWREFDTLIVAFRHQGMQQHDAWQLKAYYDKVSGYLLSALVSAPGIDNDRQRLTFEMYVVSSTDAEINRKAHIEEPKPKSRLVISREHASAGTLRFDASHRATLSADASEELKKEWAELSKLETLGWKVCNRVGDEYRMSQQLVAPGQPNYIYAVLDTLERKGYSVELAD